MYNRAELSPFGFLLSNHPSLNFKYHPPLQFFASSKLEITPFSFKSLRETFLVTALYPFFNSSIIFRFYFSALRKFQYCELFHLLKLSNRCRNNPAVLNRPRNQLIKFIFLTENCNSKGFKGISITVKNNKR